MAGSPDRQNSEGALSGLASPDNIEVLLPHASQLMSALKDGLKDLGQSLGEWVYSGQQCFLCSKVFLIQWYGHIFDGPFSEFPFTVIYTCILNAAMENSVSGERAFVKIARPRE